MHTSCGDLIVLLTQSHCTAQRLLVLGHNVSGTLEHLLPSYGTCRIVSIIFTLFFPSMLPSFHTYVPAASVSFHSNNNVSMQSIYLTVSSISPSISCTHAGEASRSCFTSGGHFFIGKRSCHKSQPQGVHKASQCSYLFIWARGGGQRLMEYASSRTTYCTASVEPE